MLLRGRRVDYGRYGFYSMTTIGEHMRTYQKEIIGIMYQYANFSS